MTLQQIEFCAKECQRQRSGELSVFNMARALHYVEDYPSVTRFVDLSVSGKIEIVRSLAYIVEPEKNQFGYRTVAVHFANFSFAIPAENIPRAMETLFEASNELDATEIYREFQKIHPFLDGNGRVASLLYNLKNNTLDRPEAPTNFFEKNKGEEDGSV